MKLSEAIKDMKPGDVFEKDKPNSGRYYMGENGVIRRATNDNAVAICVKHLEYEGQIIPAKKEPVTAAQFLYQKEICDKCRHVLEFTDDQIFESGAQNERLIFEPLMEWAGRNMVPSNNLFEILEKINDYISATATTSTDSES